MSGATPAGLADLKRRLTALPEVARAAADAALRDIGEDVTAAIRRSLDASAVSEPGRPPRDPTGGLAASLGAVVEPETSRLRIAAASPHALFLEYGTRRMAARPFLRPAVAAATPQAKERLREVIAQAIASPRTQP